MKTGKRLRWIAAGLLMAAGIGCTSIGSRGGDAGPLALDSPEQRAAWWRNNKSKAEFVPGKGYAVPGVAGFFDQNGQPMQGGGVVREASFQEEVQQESESILPELDYLRRVTGATPKRDRALAQQLFEEGETLFRKQEYTEAAGQYAKAAKAWSGSTLEDDALFMVGESYFFADAYPKANDAYAALLVKYPRSRHLDNVMARQFAIARYWQQHHQKHPRSHLTPNLFDGTRPRFDTLGHARKAFDNIRLSDPTGPLSDDAIMATANSFFLQGRYEDADYHYGLLRKDYPDSEHQFQAHVLGLQCKLRIYQGADYDGAPLEEAQKVANRLLTQFPDRLGEERERVEQLRRQLAASRAVRDWSLAEYYSGQRAYRAARYYYEQVARDYPDTKLAQEARTRLGEIRGEPDVPPQVLPWLVNLFPESREKTRVASVPPAGSGRR